MYTACNSRIAGVDHWRIVLESAPAESGTCCIGECSTWVIGVICSIGVLGPRYLVCMPRIDFAALPDRARLWVFAADRPVTHPAPLLDAVDAHLSQWAAHGVPLLCARDWRDDRFLAVAVDEAATGASGCSIDGLFRTIGRVQQQVGADLLGSGRVAWRNTADVVHVASRAEFEALAASGAVTGSTTVYETLVESVGDWRTHFERAANDSWVKGLLP